MHFDRLFGNSTAFFHECLFTNHEKGNEKNKDSMASFFVGGKNGSAFCTDIEGYFTLEASLLFPFLMILVLILIYIGFFQYDVCLMNQENHYMVLRASELHGYPTKDIERQIRIWEQGKKDRYVCFSCEGREIDIDTFSMKLKQKGKLNKRMLFKGFEERLWESVNEIDTNRTYPEKTLRMKGKK